MYYGVHVPNFGPYGDARTIAELAHEAEEAGWDGVFPLGLNLPYTQMVSPEHIQDMLHYIDAQREQKTPYDVAHWGITSGSDLQHDGEIVALYAGAGVTWWLENIIPERWGSWADWPLEAMHMRILLGPPRS